jgi:hypothetical protein
MATHNQDHNQEQLQASQYTPSPTVKTAATAAAAIGGIAFLVGAFKFQDKTWPAFLLAFFYFACLAIGGLFFAAIQSITRAGWSASVRRIAESFTAFIPFIIVGGVILSFGLKKLYPWADADLMATDALLQVKKAYLNYPFFLIRIFGFGLLMWLFRSQIVGRSLTQDKTGDDQLTHKAVPWSIGFMFAFALGFSLFSVDLLMVLLPHWYSTIWGIYCFSGLIQATFALMILFAYAIKNSGAVKGYINAEHIHDLAKFLKGFTVFWAYIAFSQYMLIWYANLPEETEFFLLRAQNGWLSISMALLIFRFIIPFLILLPRGAKRSESTLKIVCWGVLVMQFVDLYWLIYPNFNDNHVSFGILEILIFAGVAGAFLLSVFRFFAKNSPVAIKDPRMHEALNHHVTY